MLRISASLITFLAILPDIAMPQSPSITVSLDAEASDTPVDGRLLLIFGIDEEKEPRFAVKPSLDAIPIFGMNLEGVDPREAISFDLESFGFPIQKIEDLPEGPYVIQAVFHRYETFQLSTGHTVKLPMDQGEGQHWNRSPGNLFSKPQKIQWNRNRPSLEIALTEVIPPITPPEDTEYIRHVSIQSSLLTEFWGRPMHLGAHVLLPHGFDENPEARYPLVIFHGHFPLDFGGFRTEPPDPNLESVYSERFGVEGYNRMVQQEAYDFYRRWTSPDFPRFIIIEVQHANPYYDDSYAVNSANLGPYGDAINHELVPHIEKTFRGLGEGWARFLYGGSTGGWEALAVQVFYPDMFNGCFAACPDPIDFRSYCLVDIYNDPNAYYEEGPFQRILRPGHRDWLGNINSTLEGYNHYELVLGTKNRSGDQFDIWEAVYSPQGPDGYPVPLWDKRTGEINHQVAAYWKENYDLRHILARDWKKLGPKLQGKIHIYCGDMDNYYLNNAVYLMEDFLDSTRQPHYAGEIAYGDRAEHCWNGDPENPNHLTRLRYNSLYVPKILKRIEESAPEGADLTSWRY